MCLYITNKEGFIAEEDIVVYKYLEKDNLNEFRTPYSDIPVSLGSLMVPDKKEPEISKIGEEYKIERGVIYSSTSPDYFYSFESIIKKGTKFWINDELTEIASEELFVTPRRVLRLEKTDLSSLYKNHTLDLLLKDRNIVSIKDNPEKGDIIGMVLPNKYIIGIDIISDCFNEVSYESIKYFNEEETRLDYDGLLNTENILNSRIIKNLPKESYLPSFGELKEAFKYTLQINLTRKALGLDIIYNGDWFWSSNMRDKDSVWCLYLYKGRCYWDFIRDPQTKILPFIKQQI